MTTDLEVRVPYHLVPALLDGVQYRHGRESVVFGLVSDARVAGRHLLLVRSIHSLPDGAYVPDAQHGAKWSGGAMFPILNHALDQKLGVVMFHTHGGSGRVGLSTDDLQSAHRLLPTFENLIPERPHGSVVFNQTSATGVFVLPGGARPRRVTLRLLRDAIVDLTDQFFTFQSVGEDAENHRQALLTGSAGERAIHETRLVVVGLSGGGGHIVQQAAHMGFGHVVGIDADRCERSNRGRVVGMSWLDVFLRRRKTEVMRRLVRRINRNVKFTGLPELVPSEKTNEALKAADVVVGCVDNYHARADLQELTLRYGIPYVDVGLRIRAADERSVLIGGNVITSIPGRFCQWCFGFLSQERLDEETGGKPRTYFEGQEKQAQVISMNGILASQAMTEVLQLVTGFAGVTGDAVIKKYDGVRGTLEEVHIGQRMCERCRSTIDAGDPLWVAA